MIDSTQLLHTFYILLVYVCFIRFSVIVYDYGKINFKFTWKYIVFISEVILSSYPLMMETKYNKKLLIYIFN